MKKLIILCAAALIGCCLFSSCKHKKDDSEPTVVVDSLAYFSDQIKAHPKDAELYFQRAQYQYNHQFVQEAYGDILKAVKLNESCAKYYVLFADIDYARKDFDGSEENLQKALSLEPENNEVRLKLAELFYYRAEKTPSFYDECLKLLAEAREKQPHNPKAYLIEAMCYKEKGDTATYLHRLQVAIDQDPSEIKGHLELGYFYQKHLDPIGIDHYQNALRIDPGNAEINYNLGLFYRDLGRIDEAKEQFQHMLAVVPSGTYAANACYQLGYFDMQEGNYKEAAEYFSHAIEMDANFVDAYAARGEAYENLEQYDKARADYNQALRLKDNFDPAIIGLNSIDAKLKKKK